MNENKCPMPGCEGEIIYHGTEFGPDYDSWHGCTKCHFMCDLDHLPRIVAAMNAEARHNALVEAVKWDRECYAFHLLTAQQRAKWRMTLDERNDVYVLWKAAGAEVDRLIANESAADCKGEG